MSSRIVSIRISAEVDELINSMKAKNQPFDLRTLLENAIKDAASPELRLDKLKTQAKELASKKQAVDKEMAIAERLAEKQRAENENTRELEEQARKAIEGRRLMVSEYEELKRQHPGVYRAVYERERAYLLENKLVYPKCVPYLLPKLKEALK